MYVGEKSETYSDPHYLEQVEYVVLKIKNKSTTTYYLLTTIPRS